MADNSTLPAVADPTGQAEGPLIRLEFQYRQVDTILAVAYGGACFFAFWAFTMHVQSSSRQIATLGFYLLMGLAALVRLAWFASPYGVMSVTVEPPLIQMGQDGWFQFLLSEAVELLGSYLIYSIFVLIVVFWADMLRRLFTQDNVRSNPLKRFLLVMGAVFFVQAVGFSVFVAKKADSFWLMLYDDVLLCLLSLGSLVSITVYSFRMKTVLRAFLEVSQIDTTDRIKAVNWATSICSMFLVFNSIFLIYSIISISGMHRVDMLLSPQSWWMFVAVKHLLEILVLYFLLYSLWGNSSDDDRRKDGYEQIPDVLSDEETPAINPSTPKRLH